MGYIETMSKNKPSSVSIEDRTKTLERSGLRVNTPEYVIVHSTRSYPEFSKLLAAHQQRGFAGAGYHIFVGNSNRVYQGRPLRDEGAHALGFNTDSIGLAFYAPEGKLNKRKIDLGSSIISDMKEIYGNIPVISHTFAQVVYINRLLEQKGLTKRFIGEADIVNPDKFEKLKKEIDSFIGTLSTDEFGSIKEQIKAFKNCPGPLFNNFK